MAQEIKMHCRMCVLILLQSSKLNLVSKFIYLFKNTLSNSDYRASNGRTTDEKERMWEEVVVVNSRHYPGSCLEGLKETTKKPQNSWGPGQDSIRAPPTNNSKVLPREQTYLVSAVPHDENLASKSPITILYPGMVAHHRYMLNQSHVSSITSPFISSLANL